METSQQLELPIYQTSTCSSAVSPVNLLVLLEGGGDSKTQEELCFLKSHGFSPTKDPDILYSKTSKVCLVTTAEKLLKSYLKFLPKSGIAWNGKFLIQKTTAYRKIVKGCSLSDILEDCPPNKYFLSDSHIDANYGKGVDNHGQRTLIYWKNSKEKWVQENRTTTTTIKAQSDLCRQPLIKVHNLQPRNPNRPSLTRLCDCGSGKLYKKCHGSDGGSGHISRSDGIAYCLDTNSNQGIEYEDGIRRFTPKETERLQGFPDDWTKYGEDGKEISDTQRYKMTGNAVTVNVIREITRRLYA